VTFYEVDGPQAQWFQSLVDAWQELAQVSGLWRINAAGQVTSTYQYKTNSGASTILSRVRARARVEAPPVLVTNIAVPNITADKQALYFLPDRLLVREGKRFSDVAYAALTIQSESTGRTRVGALPKRFQNRLIAPSPAEGRKQNPA
jgi:hypothetical protein